MKNEICSILFLLGLCGCIAKKNSQLNLGESLDMAKVLESNEFILISSAQMEKSFKVIQDSCVFLVCVDSNKRIKYIQTKDLNFETPDGIRAGMSFREIKTILNGQEANLEPGWAQYFVLQSGWKAAFAFDKPITDDSIVSFLFKR